MSVTVYPYIIVLSYTHPREETRVEEHTVHVEAYSITDAVIQASMELEAKHAYGEQQWKQKLVAVRPDTEKARGEVASLLRDLGLIRLPTTGGKQ